MRPTQSGRFAPLNRLSACLPVRLSACLSAKRFARERRSRSRLASFWIGSHWIEASGAVVVACSKPPMIMTQVNLVLAGALDRASATCRPSEWAWHLSSSQPTTCSLSSMRLGAFKGPRSEQSHGRLTCAFVSGGLQTGEQNRASVNGQASERAHLSAL